MTIIVQISDQVFIANIEPLIEAFYRYPIRQ